MKTNKVASVPPRSGGPEIEAVALFPSRLDPFVLAILAIVSLIIFPIGLAWIGTPPSSSYWFNMPWLVAFEEGFAKGNLYPRHLPQLWYGLGGLDFFFYAPLPFYVAIGPARWLCQSCTPQTVFALQAGLLWGASVLAFYPLARRFMAPVAAGFAALTYAVLPYHLGVDWFERQAIGEFAAYVFVPIIALGMHRTLREGRMNLVLPIGVAGLMLSHLPSTLLAAHVFGVVLLCYALRRWHEVGPALGRLLAMGLIGAAIAAVFWLPAVVLLADVSPTALYDLEIMKPKPWLFFYDGLEPDRWFGKINLYTLVVALCASVFVLWRAREASANLPRSEVLAWSCLPLALVFVMNTAVAAPVWDVWVIKFVQFPWRLMVFADLSAALTAGWLATILMSRGPGRIRSASAAAMVFLGLAVAAQLPFVYSWAKLAIEIADEPVDMQGALEYLPPRFYEATDDTLKLRQWPYWRTNEIIKQWKDELGLANSSVLSVESESRRWRATPSSPGPAVLAIPYWRHMVARTETGAAVELRVEGSRGLTEAIIPEGARRIHLHLPWHWSEIVGLALSVLGLATLLTVPFLARKRGRLPRVRQRQPLRMRSDP